MNKMLKILVMPLGALPLVCAILSVVGCGKNCSKTPEVYKKDDCVRVFMHEPGRYSVFDKDLKVVSFRSIRNVSDSQLIADVPKGKSMWYEGEYRTNDGYGNQSWKWVKIHIHDISDINGGAWDTGGKHSHNVQTRPIE